MVYLFSSGCFTSTPPQVNYSNKKDFIESLNYKTIILLDNMGKEDSDKRRAVCAGVWVAKNKILTAHHCSVAAALDPDAYEMFGEEAQLGIIGINGMEVKYASNEDYNPRVVNGKQITGDHRAKIIKSDPDQDLSLLETEDEFEAYAMVSKTQIWNGMSVHAVGHPLGLLYTQTVGTVSSEMRITKFDDAQKLPTLFLQVSSPVYKGNSGGGLFDDDGQLIGICSRIAGGIPHLALFIHRDSLAKFLKE